MLNFTELDLVAFHASVVVVCERSDKFLFCFSPDMLDVTFEVIIRHYVYSYVVAQIFWARFLCSVCFQFLYGRFGFFNFPLQRWGAVAIVQAKSFLRDVFLPTFCVAALSERRPLATFKFAI